MPSQHSDYFVRPMRRDDMPAVERVTDEAFDDCDRRVRWADDPLPAPRPRRTTRAGGSKVEHLLRTDPRGCGVAEDDPACSASPSRRRDLTWILAIFAVRPERAGPRRGPTAPRGRPGPSVGCLRSILWPRRTRWRAPLPLGRVRPAPDHGAAGPVPRSALPVVERVREGSLGDLDLMDSVDRRVRDSAHGVDHEILAESHRLVVADRTTGSGYAYVTPAGGLAARRHQPAHGHRPALGVARRLRPGRADQGPVSPR